MTLADSYAAGQLDDVEERLLVRFCPPLRPDEVQRHLVEVIGAFEHARVRTYLPILVERAAARRLEAAAATARGRSAPATPGRGPLVAAGGGA